MCCAIPREVDATVGELHAAGLVIRVRSHAYDLHRVNGRAPFDVDDVKPINLQKKSKGQRKVKGVRHEHVQRENV
jgi:hypothetical protein